MQPGDTKELEELISLAINNKDIYRSIKNGATDMVEYSSFEYWSDKMLSIIKENNNEA